VSRVRALDHLREVVVAEAAAAERVAELDRQHAERLAELGALLERHGELAPTDAAEARAGVVSLERRSRALREARAAIERAQGDCDRLTRQIEADEQEQVRIYRTAELELDDRAGLSQRMRDWAQRNELIERRREVDAAVRSEHERLVAAGEAALAERPIEDLEAERTRLQSLADDYRDVVGRIARIKSDLDRARGGHALEEAIARRDECRLALRDRRDEQLAAAAGQLLLDLVRDEHERDQMPPVLERAREHFARFTHQRYELQVTPRETGSFVALETTTGRVLRPDQLSDGTRVQLLLAARLAFAEQAERGAPLPLFLDEALDHSDPVRFDAIARGLARLVADGDRQVFYLTNDPTDVARIERAFREEGLPRIATHDLAAVRGVAAAVAEPARLVAPPLPRVPEPGAASFEMYAVALGVPAFDPARGAAAQHLAYLLWDDLAALHALLERHVQTVGQWQRVHGDDRTDMAGPAERQLADRVALLEVFCTSWQIGRGRPVDRGVIEESNAIRGKFFDAVIEIAAELEGDAERLVETLLGRTDERLSGFRSNQAEDLAEYLTEHGFLDPRPVMSRDDLAAQVLAAPAARRLPASVARECVHRWWEWLAAGGRPSAAPAAS
jgi:hypothetical protein